MHDEIRPLGSTCSSGLLHSRSGSVPPNKRLKLPGGDRSKGTGVLCPGGHDLTFIYSAPQLKRDPLGSGTHRRRVVWRTAAPWHCLGPISVTIALVLLTVPGAHLAAQDRASGSTPEDSVRAVELTRAQALLRADTTALSRMVGDEFIEISRLGQLRTKADNIRDIASGALKLTSVKYDSLTVRIYGDVAVLRGIADNTGSFRGIPFTGRIRYTRVFVRRDGRWQAVAMQQTASQ